MIRQSIVFKHLAPLALLAAMAGCTTTTPQPGGGQVITQPPVTQPSSGPTITPPPTTPSTAPTRLKSHPRFAPPPGGNSYWDTTLNVYVLPDQTYYRDRTYYRWSDGWTWASHPNGPWQAADLSEIPPGLSRKYAQ